jgi:hypothetical protein
MHALLLPMKRYMAGSAANFGFQVTPIDGKDGVDIPGMTRAEGYAYSFKKNKRSVRMDDCRGGMGQKKVNT